MEPYQSESNARLGEQTNQEGQQEQSRATEKPQEAREDTSLTQKLLAKAGLAKEMSAGLMAVVCEIGMQTLSKLLEQEVTERVGAKGKHNKERKGVRHGYDDGEVTLGGRRVRIRRPRMRLKGGKELPSEIYQWAAGRDVLNRMAYQQVMLGVSTRGYQLSLEPVSARDAHRPRSVSRSAISRRFIALTRTAMDLLFSRDLREIRAVVLMIDGIHVAGRMLLVAMVIDVDGQKHPVALREGATENARVVKDLLADLVDRGLNYKSGLLVCIDGSKALASAVRATFGDLALIQRCQEHKVRNVTDYLHKEEKPWVTRQMRKTLRRTDAQRAKSELLDLAKRLEETNIEAARSLREGLDELLTIMRLGVGQVLARTLRTTNAIESMNEIIRAKTRWVKRWRDGDMRERWVAAAMLEAESQFRRVEGYKELPALAATLYQVCVLNQQPPAEGARAAMEEAAA